jgi:hypothetical protein
MPPAILRTAGHASTGFSVKKTSPPARRWPTHGCRAVRSLPPRSTRVRAGHQERHVLQLAEQGNFRFRVRGPQRRQGRQRYDKITQGAGSQVGDFSYVRDALFGSWDGRRKVSDASTAISLRNWRCTPLPGNTTRYFPDYGVAGIGASLPQPCRLRHGSFREMGWLGFAFGRTVTGRSYTEGRKKRLGIRVLGVTDQYPNPSIP